MFTKKVFLTFIAILLVASMIAGCGTTAAPNSSPAASATSTATVTEAPIASATAVTPAELKPMEVTYAFWGNEKWGSDPKDQYVNDFGKKFNVTLKPIAMTWSDWTDKLKLWAASSTLPDMFANDEPYFQWAKQGLLKGISKEQIKQYPNVWNYILPGIMDALTLEDGKIYTIPRGHWLVADGGKALNLAAIYTRTEYLAKAGLTAAPDTLDGWVSYLKKAVSEDFSGTGKTTGMDGIVTNICIYPFVPEFGDWMQEDGKWIPSYVSKKNVKALQFIKKLYDEGLLNKDYVLIKADDARALFVKGSSIVTQNNGDPDMIAGGFITADAGTNSATGQYITLVVPPKAEDGKKYFPSSPNYWSQLGISNKVDDAKLDRILMLLDYDGSAEGRMYGVYGVKDVDYKLEGSNVVNLLPMDSATGKQKKANEMYDSANLARFLLTWDLPAAMSNPTHTAEIRKKSADYYAAVGKECTIIEPNWKVQLMSTPAKDKLPNMNQDYMDMVAKMLTTNLDPEAAFNTWVTEEMKKIGTAITEVNANVK